MRLKGGTAEDGGIFVLGGREESRVILSNGRKEEGDEEVETLTEPF